MYPKIPYEGLSWPITQHAGVLNKESLDGLLNAALQCHGKEADTAVINDYLVSRSLLTKNVRADSNQVDAWRDYQQILSEFGLIYSTRLSNEIRLTPVAFAYLHNRLNYEELITLQIMRYQYPNGHKSQFSTALKESYGDNFSSLTELQANFKILVHPAVIVWNVLYGLWKRGEMTVLTKDEMQNYVTRCTCHADEGACVDSIITARKQEMLLPPLSGANVRRNASDWFKLLNQTPLFTLNAAGDSLVFSPFSIKESDEIIKVTKLLAEPSSFWIFNRQSDFKKDWFDFYGDYDNSLDLIIKVG